MTIECGTCRKWFANKAYGFIKSDQGIDVFVHVTSTQDRKPLVEGQRVEFERITANDGRYRATAVRPIESAPDTPWWGKGELT